MTAIAIVVKKDLPKGLLGNICACLATGIVTLDPAVMGHDIDAGEVAYKAITKVPIVVLEEGARGIKEVRARAAKAGLPFVLYDKLAVGATDYDHYARAIQ